MKQTDADHCEDSNNLLFWNKLFFIVLDDITKTLVALLHNDARKILCVFDKIDYSHNQWVIESSQAANFSFSGTDYLSIVILRANTILESFSSIYFTVYFRLDFEDNCLAAFFDNLDGIIVVIISPKSCRIYQLKIGFGTGQDVLIQSVNIGDTYKLM